MRKSPFNILRRSEGLALFMVIFVMAFFLLFVTGGLIFSQLDLKKASNLKLATQAVETADAGLQHALAMIPWAWNFNNQLNSGTPPGTVVSQTDFPSGSGFSYTVTARNDIPSDGGGATNDTNNILVLTSTASGPSGTKKVVEAYVKRSLVSFTPPGAVYLRESPVTITFDSGTGFFITGNDTDYSGSPAASPKPAVSGVAPTNDSVRDSFKSSLGSSRYNLAQGSGYLAGPPVTPSVFTTTNVFDVNQSAVNLYNYPNAVKYLDGLNLNCSSSNPCTLGTDSSPQITYIRESNNNHIHLDGYVTGSGILVMEGKSHLYGNFNFHGLVIRVRLGLTGGASNMLDDTDPVSMRNNAKIFGAILVAGSAFDMRNSVKLYYSSQALSMVNNNWGSQLPQPARVLAWLDK